MNTEKIERLLEKYFEGTSTLQEEAQLREYFRNEDIPDRLKSYRNQFLYAGEMGQSEPGDSFDPLAKINNEKGEVSPTSSGKERPAPRRFEKASHFDNPVRHLSGKIAWTLRIAAGLILLLVGFSAGLLVNRQPTVSNQQVAALQQEIQQMKSALVYGSDKPLTASERISAVKLSNRVPENKAALDSEITEILIYTMNNDQNVNVREAAAEALFRFRSEERIRMALVNSLSKQRDPLMQMTLINMLVELKEKSAINEMQKLLMDSDTREVVKSRLEVGIAELKT